MSEQDWTPVVWTKDSTTKDTTTKVSHEGKEQFRKLDGDDPNPPKKPPIELRLRVCRARQDNKMTQKDLAGKIGVRESVVRDFENGKFLPNNLVLEKICRLLKIAKNG